MEQALTLVKRMRNSRSDSEKPEMNNELRELFLDELADLLSTEKQLTKALPKLVKITQIEELANAIGSHLTETEQHVVRLQMVFQSLGKTPKIKKCKAMEGILAEGGELLAQKKGTPALDAALIAAAQKVEHYEIASYGTVCAWARQLGHAHEEAILLETLNEEKAADEKLTGIAEKIANQHAVAMG